MSMSWQTVEQRLEAAVGVLGAAGTALNSAMDGGGDIPVATTDDIYYSMQAARHLIEDVITHLPTDGGEGSE